MKWLTHSMMLVILAFNHCANAATLVKVHRLDNTPITLNATKIAGLTPTVHPKGSPHRLMHAETNCIVHMGNGRIQGIKETCDAVEEMIRAK